MPRPYPASLEMGPEHPCLLQLPPPPTPGDSLGSQNQNRTGPKGLQGLQEELLPGPPPSLLSLLASSLGSDLGQQPASPVRHPDVQEEKISRVRSFFLSTDPKTRGHRAAATLGLGRFCLRCRFHFNRAAQLQSCLTAVASNGGRPSPRLLVSQVPLLGMCLPLRVPVAAWKWTEAQRVTKRGSPCAEAPRGSWIA